MITAENAILKTRRWLTLSAITRWVLGAVALLALLAGPMLEKSGLSAFSVLAVVGGLWLVLSFRSFRGSRFAADSSTLIASGRFDQAEENITEALNAFSIFRTMKLMSLHHLAVLRHAQRRWQDAAMLSRAVLSQRLGTVKGLDRSTRLILAESLLEMGDVAGAYENLAWLYQQRLTLREATNLLAVQMDYMARIGAWDQMFAGITAKVETAELMPTLPAAQTQAFLALAAKRVGRTDWWQWLRRRVELLVDIQQLCAARPMLWEVWS